MLASTPVTADGGQGGGRSEQTKTTPQIGAAAPLSEFGRQQEREGRGWSSLPALNGGGRVDAIKHYKRSDLP
ncbi:hypothetical protein E2562_036483 [Oryza meyeriana var. granulata]|uniref:Uncharacterized protein n=1 Tax=Oryza meyeriana var. granulata TaxID=110450 RepID=A0A6G1DS79_9ORYZ|nr:hypothetical protein E2562_036483 [Oryza meyeriana var. granulata]